ncbi:MAG: hypothetical protein IJA91_04990 [Clostridia bacterium]|nr:hypothetical protein [Clostridia bacterium]
MSKRKLALRNGLSSVLGYAVSLGVGLLLPRLFITGYGSEVNGLLGSVNQFLLYLGLLEAGMGALTLQALYKPVAEDDRSAINTVLSATHRYYKRAGLVYLLALIAAALLFPLIAGSSLPYLAVAGVVFFSGAGTLLTFWLQGKYQILLQAAGKSYVQTNLTTLVTLLAGIAKVVMIALDCGIVPILAVSFAIHGVQAFCILWYVKVKYKWIALDMPPAEGVLVQKNYMILHRVAEVIFHNTDILLLTVFCDLKIVSVYTLYKLIFSYLERILAILSGSVSFALGQNYQTDRGRFIARMDVFESVYGIAATTLFSTALHLTVPFMALYTHGVTDAVYCDPTLALLFAAIAWLTAIRQPMLLTINYAGHFKETVPQTLIETGINLVVSLVGVLLWGIHGVLLGTVAALLYRSVEVILYANKRLLGRTPLRSLAVHSVCLVLMVGVQLFWCVCPLPVDSFGVFLLVGLAETVVTALLFGGVHLLLFPSLRHWVAVQLRYVSRQKTK